MIGEMKGSRVDGIGADIHRPTGRRLVLAREPGWRARQFRCGGGADFRVDHTQFCPTPLSGHIEMRGEQPVDPGGSNGGQAYSLAGGLTFGVAWVLDGATHNNPYDNLNLPLPFPDALQEFRAETSAMTAQNGMHSGGAVNAVTKSGTNSFRGDLFEFFRHHSLNATDPFATKKPDGTRKDDGLKRRGQAVLPRASRCSRLLLRSLSQGHLEVCR